MASKKRSLLEWTLSIQLEALYEYIYNFEARIMATMEDVIKEVAALRTAATDEKNEVKTAFNALEVKIAELQAAVQVSPSAPDLQPVMDALMAAKDDVAGIFSTPSAVEAVPTVDPSTVEFPV